MCGPAAVVPAWVAYASVAATVASTAMTAYGMYQQGQNQKKEAAYKSAIANNNAIRAGYMADDALARGKIAESQQRLRGRLLIGQMRSQLAGTGQDINEGSAMEMVVDQAGVNELDALNVRNNAEREAQNYRLQATDFDSQSNLLTFQGNNAAKAGMMGAAGSVLGGAGDVAGKWYNFNKAGAFSGSSSAAATRNDIAAFTGWE